MSYCSGSFTINSSACAFFAALNICSLEKFLPKAREISTAAKEKIKAKEYDSSQNQFWINKNPDKFWILEKLYFQSKTKELVGLIFNLLELFPLEIKNSN